MTGTPLAYFLWVRWASGEKDCFEITHEEYKGFHTYASKMCLIKTKCSDGNYVMLDLEKAAAVKLFKRQKEVYKNPFNNPNYYENPLN